MTIVVQREGKKQRQMTAKQNKTKQFEKGKKKGI
jgi:hypothetical protein